MIYIYFFSLTKKKKKEDVPPKRTKPKLSGLIFKGKDTLRNFSFRTFHKGKDTLKLFFQSIS